MPFEPASDVLSQYTVLDLTRVRSGPTCVRQLADWGANVIKIEDPESDKIGLGGARSGSDFQNLHRNKRSMTLNLKSKEGIAIFMALAIKVYRVTEGREGDRAAKELFAFSIFYLFLLFAVLLAEQVVRQFMA